MRRPLQAALLAAAVLAAPAAQSQTIAEIGMPAATAAQTDAPASRPEPWAVPEARAFGDMLPAPVWMLIAGLAGVAFLRYRSTSAG